MKYNSYYNLRLLTTCMVVLLACGCGSGKRLLTIHKAPIEQGNLYEHKHIAKLQVGMSKEQVRYIIGSPMLEDPFNKNRWDYYYSFTNNKNELVKTHHLVLYFDDDESLSNIHENIPVTKEAKSLRGKTQLRQRDDDALLLDQ